MGYVSTSASTPAIDTRLVLQNQMPPSTIIHELPDEILLIIFPLYALETWEHESEGWECFLRTLRLGQVCSRWRQLVVEHLPQLWRKFALIPPPKGVDATRREHWEKFRSEVPPPPGQDWDAQGADADVDYDFNQEMLRRCEGHTLQAGWEAWKLGALPPETVASTLLTYGSRIDSYELLLEDPDNADELMMEYENTTVLDALRDWSPTSLRRLCISYWNRAERHKSFLLPGKICDGNLSSLKHLYLFMVWFDVEDHDFGENLESLSLQLTFPTPASQNPSFPASLEEWTRILPRMPNLTYFSLILTLPIRDQFVPPTTILPDIVHNHITYVYMVIDFHDLRVFLDHIFLPACRTLHLSISIEEAEDFSAYTEEIIHRYAHPSLFARPRMTMYYRCTSHGGFGCGILRRGDKKGGGVRTAVDAASSQNMRVLEPALLDLAIFLDGCRSFPRV